MKNNVFTFDFEALVPYRALSEMELIERIREHKERRRDELALFVHNYQRWEIIELADRVGDSLELARMGSAMTEVPFIVFCGVHFMAETARILASPAQRVLLPNLFAGCPMADLADLDEVARAWSEIEAAAPQRYLPVVYVNSTAELKAFCGERGGITVTSGNAEKVLRWVKDRGMRPFFLPDEHLGRNTARLLGIPSEKILSWDWMRDPRGGNAAIAIAEAEMIVWKGYCHVHTHFTPSMVAKARAEHPDAIIMVHPECPEEVALAADRMGSTKTMSEVAAALPAGSTLILGTEVNHPANLQRRYPEKRILPLGRSLCPNMFKINLRNLLYTLDHLGEVNEIRLDEAVISKARLALDRMLAAS